MSIRHQTDCDRFPTTTHWTQVYRAGNRANATQARQALDQLLRRYRPALRAYLIRNARLGEHEADDLLQEFIVRKFLERNLPGEADPARGKFRTLVLTALDRFLVSQARRRNADKRLGDRAKPLDADRIETCVAHPLSRAADSFEVAWAREILSEAARRMEAECRASDRQDLWAVFEARVLRPAFDGAEPVDYAGLVERFGFRSPSQAANVLVTAKRMFDRTLRVVVGEYALPDEPIDEEIRDLRRILATSGAESR